MKKVLMVLISLLAMMAFVSGVLAQDKPAATEKPKVEKAKASKPKAPKVLKASGAVTAYEAGKMIKVKGKNKEMEFDIAPKAKVRGEVKEGAKVTVSYKKDGDKMVATAISVPAVKKQKVSKKDKKEEQK